MEPAGIEPFTDETKSLGKTRPYVRTSFHPAGLYVRLVPFRSVWFRWNPQSLGHIWATA